MKKILFAMLAAACVFAGCQKFIDEKTPELGTVSVPTISNVEFDDYTLSATVTPAEGTAYYAYAVVEGSGEVDPSTLLANSVKGAIASETVKFEAKSKVSFTVEDLTPNTTYTIYAIASNISGVKSDVVSVTKTTSDNTYPARTGYSTDVDGEHMMFIVIFDEDITLTGNGAVTAFFYAENDKPDAKGQIAPAYEVNIDLGTLIAAGKLLGIPIPAAEYQPGAYVVINYTDGIVKNATGLLNVAYEKNGFDVEEGPAGMWEQYDYESFDLIVGDLDDAGDVIPFEDTPVVFSDYNDFQFVIGVDTEEAIVVDELEASYTYLENSGRSVKYSAVPQVSFALAARLGLNCSIAALTEAPAFGASVSIEIFADLVFDRWGNGNNAYEAQDIFFCSFGYAISDFTGTFTFKSPAGLVTGEPISDRVIIAEADDYEYEGEDPGYNVMIAPGSTICGAPVMMPVYGWADLDSGTLTIENWADFWVREYPGPEAAWMDFVIFDYNNQDADYIVFSHPDADTYLFDGLFAAMIYYLDDSFAPLDYEFLDVANGWNGTRNSGGFVPVVPITSSVAAVSHPKVQKPAGVKYQF